jgi:hypothetical protein
MIGDKVSYAHMETFELHEGVILEIKEDHLGTELLVSAPFIHPPVWLDSKRTLLTKRRYLKCIRGGAMGQWEVGYFAERPSSDLWYIPQDNTFHDLHEDGIYNLKRGIFHKA